MIASWCELSGVSLFQVVCFQAPFIFLAPECSVLFSLLHTFGLILYLSVHNCGISCGFASLLGDLAVWYGRALSCYLALASPCKMPIKHIKIYVYLWTVQGKKKGQYRRWAERCLWTFCWWSGRIVENSSSELCKRENLANSPENDRRIKKWDSFRDTSCLGHWQQGSVFHMY